MSATDYESDPGAELVREARERADLYKTVAPAGYYRADILILCDLAEKYRKERDTFATRCDRLDAMLEGER